VERGNQQFKQISESFVKELTQPTTERAIHEYLERGEEGGGRVAGEDGAEGGEEAAAASSG